MTTCIEPGPLSEDRAVHRAWQARGVPGEVGEYPGLVGENPAFTSAPRQSRSATFCKSAGASAKHRVLVSVSRVRASRQAVLCCRRAGRHNQQSMLCVLCAARGATLLCATLYACNVRMNAPGLVGLYAGD